MGLTKTNAKWDDLKVLVTHVLIGIAVFYFIIHPLTMVIYWFEFNQVDYSLSLFIDTLLSRMRFSFSIHMIKMSAIFIGLGALIGLGSGLYYNSIRKRNKKIASQAVELNHTILSSIEQGENNRVEFKSSLRYDYRTNEINTSLESAILKSIAGFLNAKGGRLIIGVADDGQILGLTYDYQSLKKKDCDGFELKMFQLVADRIGPEICSFVHLNFHVIDHKEICVLNIEESTIPVYVNENQNTKFFVRTGNSTKPLTIREAVKYIKMKETIV